MTTYIHIDNDSTGGGDGSSWDVSGASAAYTLAEYDAWASLSLVAGTTIFIKPSTAGYTLTGNADMQSKDGSISAPIKFIGVKEATTNVGVNVAYSDWAIDRADQPDIDVGDYFMTFGQYWYIANLDIVGTDAAYLVSLSDTKSIVQNCSAINTGNGEAIRASQSNCKIVGCYLKSTNNEALNLSANETTVLFCHIDGSATGILTGSFGARILHTIVSDCTTGINVYDDDSFEIINCTIDGCISGITGTSAEVGTVINSVISNCTDGWKFNNSGTAITSTFMDYNNWYNNTSDMSWDNGVSEDNSTKGPNDTAVNPNYTSASTDDYSLADGDCIDGGMSIVLGVG